MTSMRRNDVASTSFRRHMPNRFLINQCQIITFLILKYDIIENSRIELRGIVLPVQVGGLLGGGQRVCWPPLSNYWGGGAAPPPPGPPLPTPMQWELTLHMAATDDVFGGTYFCLSFPIWCLGWDLELNLSVLPTLHLTQKKIDKTSNIAL